MLMRQFKTTEIVVVFNNSECILIIVLEFITVKQVYSGTVRIVLIMDSAFLKEII